MDDWLKRYENRESPEDFEVRKLLSKQQSDEISNRIIEWFDDKVFLNPISAIKLYIESFNRRN